MLSHTIFVISLLFTVIVSNVQANLLEPLRVEGTICDLTISTPQFIYDDWDLMQEDYKSAIVVNTDEECWDSCVASVSNVTDTRTNKKTSAWNCHAVMIIEGSEFSPPKSGKVCYRFINCGYTKLVGLPESKQANYVVYSGIIQDSENRHHYVWESSNLT